MGTLNVITLSGFYYIYKQDSNNSKDLIRPKLECSITSNVTTFALQKFLIWIMSVSFDRCCISTSFTSFPLFFLKGALGHILIHAGCEFDPRWAQYLWQTWPKWDPRVACGLSDHFLRPANHIIISKNFN